MTISDYIAILEKIRAEHGDLEVYQRQYGVLGAVMPSTETYSAAVTHLAILSGRERAIRTVHSHEPEEKRGTKILRIGG